MRWSVIVPFQIWLIFSLPEGGTGRLYTVCYLHCQLKKLSASVALCVKGCQVSGYRSYLAFEIGVKRKCCWLLNSCLFLFPSYLWSLPEPLKLEIIFSLFMGFPFSLWNFHCFKCGCEDAEELREYSKSISLMMALSMAVNSRWWEICWSNS